MAFFDAQPAGRLLNRFSKDTEAADISLRENLAYWISETCALQLAVPPLFLLLNRASSSLVTFLVLNPHTSMPCILEHLEHVLHVTPWHTLGCSRHTMTAIRLSCSADAVQVEVT